MGNLYYMTRNQQKIIHPIGQTHQTTLKIHHHQHRQNHRTQHYHPIKIAQQQIEINPLPQIIIGTKLKLQITTPTLSAHMAATHPPLDKAEQYQQEKRDATDRSV
jgi:hypothetical protein